MRELSGTSIQGTTLLGLCQAATGLGFKAEGFEANGVQNLHELSSQIHHFNTGVFTLVEDEEVVGHRCVRGKFVDRIRG
ncbi:hypothetical protein GCM10027347_08520 [Larkinella harenae]